MKRGKLLSLGFMLFLLSFLFIFTGLYLDYEEKHSFSDPIQDVLIITDSNDDVIISTTGDDKDGDHGDNGVFPTDEVPNPDSNFENGSGDTNTTVGGDDTPPSSNNQDPNHSIDTKNEEDIGNHNQMSDIEVANDIFRRTIEGTYGIKVRYGSDTSNYVAGNMNTISIEDPIAIQSALNQLNVTLALYPKGFFGEFSDVNLNLEIYLVQRYSTTNVTGVTDLSGNGVIVSIAMDYSFVESFHHEIYHYIEHFIERKHGEFSNWNTYNPKNFNYGTVNNNLSFNRTNNPEAPFVNNYAQTNADEDRASLFEYMTADIKATCFDSAEYPIWKKSSYVALMIDTYFDTVSPSIVDYWERYIY